MTATLYTKPGCVQCNALKQAMERQDIDFGIVDISEDADAYDLVVGLGYRQVPVVIAGDYHFSGFNPAKLDELAQAASLPRP